MRCARFFRSLKRRGDEGASAVEFALLTPLLMAIFLPMADIGLAAFDEMQVQDAAEAGAMYALANGYSSSSVTTAAQNATSLGSNVSVSPSEACYCMNSGTLTSESNCSTTCSDSTTAGTYVTVSTSYSYTPLISYGTLPVVSYYHVPSSFSLSGSAFVRIK